MNLSEWLTNEVELTDSARWTLAAGMFVLGAVLGSFMNVLVYRLPRGMSLSRPGSQCPACGHAIRWYDNVPILGWIRLGGRCRDCRARISSRYPLVELTMALLAAVLLLALTRPALEVAAEQGHVARLAAGEYALHMLLLGALIVAALIEFDGNSVPPRLPLIALVLAMAVAWLLPGGSAVRVPPFENGTGLSQSLLGAAAGIWLALLAWPGWIGAGQLARITTALANSGALVLVGACLGAQAVLLIGPPALMLALVSNLAAWRIPAARGLSWPLWLLLGTIVMIAAGQRWGPWLNGPEGPTILSLAVASAILVIALAIAGRAMSLTAGSDAQ